MWFAHRALLGLIGLARSLALLVIGVAQALSGARDALTHGIGADIEDGRNLGSAEPMGCLEQKSMYRWGASTPASR